MPFVIQFAIGPYRWMIKLCAGLSAIFITYVIILTGSRLGVIGCLLSFMLSLLAWAVVRWRTTPNSILAPAITLAYPALFLATVVLTYVSHTLRGLVWGNGPQDASNQGRADQIHMGLPMIWHHPWGYGISMGARTLGYFGSGEELTIDNDYLRIALEYGVVGFVMYYGMFIIAIGYVVYALVKVGVSKSGRDFRFLVPLAISIAIFFVIKSVLSQQEVDPLVFIMMGMIAALVRRARA